MRMNYPVQNRQAGASKLAMIIAVLILLAGIFLRDPLGYWLTRALSPVASGIWEVRNDIRGGDQDLLGISGAIDKRIELLTEENQALKESLGHTFSSSTKLVNILSSLYSSPYDTFIIDEGSDEGLSVGDHIVSTDGIALGEIIEVYPKISKILLYSAPGNQMEVFLDNLTRVKIQGEGNQNFFAELPRGIDITASSTFALVGDGNFILARILNVKNNQGDAFQKIFARSPINIHTLKFVYVIR
jgi:cell shape-determining protein MreC